MIGLVAATGLVLLAGGADAQSVMDLAKREGKVVWYSSLGLSLAQKVCDTFNKKNLGITCELNRDGSERIFQKVMQEAGANLWIADVVHTSDISHFLDFKTKGMLAKYAPAGSEKFRAEFKDPEGLYYILRGSPYVIGINTQKVAKAEAPKRWKDLLDPRWKGKLVQAHPGYSGVVVTGITGLVGAFGWDYFAALAKNAPLVVQSAEDPPMKISGGEAWAGASAEYNLYRALKKGNPLEIIFPEEGVPFVSSANAVMAKAPHPNAARVFTDYLFGKEAQQILVDDGLYVPSEEVTYAKDKRPLKEIKILPATPEEILKRNEEIKEKFRELFGV
ncbi:MAG TPA: extracellular solute-binding protein [Methylomirabilota bacterium]|nr:extracellular solute-binding protein [Methylomirabilota bacterium]